MNRDDITKVAQGAPSLHELFVISVPDCLLIRSWARQSRSEPEAAAAHLGNLYRVAQEAMPVVGIPASPSTMIVEVEGGIVLITALSSEIVAGFVFDLNTPLGLVRVQSRQLADQLRAHLVNAPLLDDAPAVPSLPPMRPAVAINDSAPPREPPRRETRPPPRPFSIPPATTPPPLATSSVAPKRADAAAGLTLTPAKTPQRPRAVRLMEYFRRYAPDPHAASLRLSLRTGLSLDVLDKPERLDDAQVEALAAAIRDILGQEQLGI